MINMKNKTLSCALLSILCLAATPAALSAQEASHVPNGLIDVFQDGTLFITYEEYLERQRRVMAAQAAARTTAAPLVMPTHSVPVTAQVGRTSNTMALRSQWQIGAFR